MDTKHETTKLKYTIHKFSTYSVNFLPQYILQNTPGDLLSRWFTDSTSPNQYLILKLQTPAIVESITFGKYTKSHVSNLKKFQIFGGTRENNMSLLLQAGLKNDAEAEVLKLRHKTQDGLYLPVNYIKIVPLQSWGPAYNYSIWFVELMGMSQHDLISQALETINLSGVQLEGPVQSRLWNALVEEGDFQLTEKIFTEAVAGKFIHLRRRRYKDAFEALSRESGVQLEGPVQSRLWNALVEEGDFQLTEKIFTEAVAGKFIHLRRRRYKDAFEALSRESGVQLEGPVQSRLWNALVEEGDFQLTEKIFTEAVAGKFIHLRRRRYKDAFEALSRESGVQLEGLVQSRLWNALVEEHLRRRRYKDAFEALSRESGVQLEGPVQSRLWNALVEEGDFQLTEKIFTEAVAGKFINLRRRRYKDAFEALSRESGVQLEGPVQSRLWNALITACSSQVEAKLSAPVMRPPPGFGPRPFDLNSIDRDVQADGPLNGQNGDADMGDIACGPDGCCGKPGPRDLDDLWAYSTTEEKWTLLCRRSQQAGGPGPRSCHKMVFDPVHRRLYTLGRDEAANPQYSGLYAYYIATNTWQLLLPDKHSLPAPQSRVSHSMLFHPVSNTQYSILGPVRVLHSDEHVAAPPAGQALAARAAVARLALHALPSVNTQYSGLYAYYIATNTWQLLLPDKHSLPAPQSRGMSKEKERRVYNTLWVFSLQRLTWNCVYRNESVSPNEPRPRFAHQLVYDPVNKNHPRVRLDDLWSLELLRPSARDVQRRAVVLHDEEAASPAEWSARHDRLRLYEELCMYFRTSTVPPDSDVTDLVLGGDEESLSEPFRPFEEIPAPEPETWEVGHDEEAASPAEWSARHDRLRLYEELCMYFRPSTVPPDSDVTDLVTL
ncbi:putative Muskelin [Operophtera brumata]|uniref:Putative Muskelin n=1 Tax=Operophtera brumata TaxID=104452 RepID=A0A0L7LIV1_OPEBR|nr:putative Muskelin [Operophtera brumata]